MNFKRAYTEKDFKENLLSEHYRKIRKKELIEELEKHNIWDKLECLYFYDEF